MGTRRDEEDQIAWHRSQDPMDPPEDRMVGALSLMDGRPQPVAPHVTLSPGAMMPMEVVSRGILFIAPPNPDHQFIGSVSTIGGQIESVNLNVARVMIPQGPCLIQIKWGPNRSDYSTFLTVVGTSGGQPMPVTVSS